MFRCLPQRWEGLQGWQWFFYRLRHLSLWGGGLAELHSHRLQTLLAEVWTCFSPAHPCLPHTSDCPAVHCSTWINLTLSFWMCDLLLPSLVSPVLFSQVEVSKLEDVCENNQRSAYRTRCQIKCWHNVSQLTLLPVNTDWSGHVQGDSTADGPTSCVALSSSVWSLMSGCRLMQCSAAS